MATVWQWNPQPPPGCTAPRLGQWQGTRAGPARGGENDDVGRQPLVEDVPQGVECVPAVGGQVL